MIPYNHFAQLDIRLGKILAVEIVPDADKLLALTVDLGEEKPRQIISGIREYVGDPKELVGVTTPFIVNLEPRVIRGHESQGMLLAARSEDGGFALLLPSSQMPAGARVV